ncbi:MAG: response regulator transcription factor [Tannerellaceae bacterium]|jgi:DNA-binding NarL/FixJ family response regulator|nr:response regulator transcription factor [Tannerellaceae bacterium]
MGTYILADNQDVTRAGINALLTETRLVDRIVEAGNRKELQDKLRLYPSAIVILDYTLFDFVSLQQMLIIKEKAHDSSWLLFSDDLAERFLRQLLVADPTFSVVMKHDSREEILSALQNVTFRKTYHCEFATHVLRQAALAGSPTVLAALLTPSERTVLGEIARGKTTKEIAFEKNLSFHTINSHRKNIFRKLEVNNVQEAVKYAIRAGISDVADYAI